MLAATTELFAGYFGIQWQFRGLELIAAAVRRLPRSARNVLFRPIATLFCLRYPRWVRDEVLQCDPVALLEAGAVLGSFNSSTWIGELPMPVSVIVTSDDRVVQPDFQYRLADDADAVITLRIDADHDLPVRNDPRFTDALTAAIRAIDTASVAIAS